MPPLVPEKSQDTSEVDISIQTLTEAVLERPDRYPSTRKSFQSSIPHPRTRYYHDGPSHIHITDLDQRYEDNLRDRPKLTVANAEVSISGSSSESDAGDHESLLRMRNHANYQSCSPVGLGLSFRHDSSSRAAWNNARTLERPGPRPVVQEKNPRFSLPVSESSSSTYSDELANRPAGRNCRPVDADINHSRRGAEFEASSPRPDTYAGYQYSQPRI